MSARNCYSQCGEDMIIEGITSSDRGRYLDIGAYDAKFISNTYRKYELDFDGVLIEPNPDQYAKIKSERPRDVCIWAGVAWTDPCPETATMYCMTAATLNTFSHDGAIQTTKEPGYGRQLIEKTIEVPLVKINDILQQHFNDGSLCLLSIDTEGMDLAILQTMDWDKWRPDVVCAETDGGGCESKEEMIGFMKSVGYYVGAWTHLNTIFRREPKNA